MPDIVRRCIYEAYIEPPSTIWTTFIDFLCSLVIGLLGVIVNYRFLKKLQKEKRSRPEGRKGNVIEPVMQLFCKVQILYWPYYLLYFWLQFNGIIPSSFMSGWSWSCLVIAQEAIKFGRNIIAWNSAFVAFIRYIYIVHREKSNQWDFDRVGKWFRVASIGIPTVYNTIDVLTNGVWEYQRGDAFYNCISFNLGLNNTNNFTTPNIYPYAWSVEYLPKSLILSIYYTVWVLKILIYGNIVDGYFYLSIYRCIKR